VVELVTSLSLPLEAYDLREGCAQEIQIRQSAQAFHEPVECLDSLPLLGHCLQAQDNLLQVDIGHHFGQTHEARGRYTLINPSIEVTWRRKMGLLFSIRPSEEVSVIDEDCREAACCVFQKECLPIVRMTGANIDHPSQPEELWIANATEACTGKDLPWTGAQIADEERAKAEARGWTQASANSVNPALRITVEEGIGDYERFPRWAWQPECAIKQCSRTFVEGKVCALEVVGEFDDVVKPIARPNKNGL
jgi:hypothetical protein